MECFCNLSDQIPIDKKTRKNHITVLFGINAINYTKIHK